MPTAVDYSDVEQATMRTLYATHGPQHLAIVLGKPLYNVKKVAGRMGLRYNRPPLTSEQARRMAAARDWPALAPLIEARLRQLWPTHSASEVARQLNLPDKTVRRYGKRLALGRAGAQRPPVAPPPKPAKPVKPPKPAPAPKLAKEKAAPVVVEKKVKALPAVQKPTKDAEPLAGLAAQLRALPFTDPLRVAYLKATKPGTKAGTAPQTMAQLRALL